MLSVSRIKRQNEYVRLDTIKLFEENIGRTFFDINHTKIFFVPPPRVIKIKTKIYKCDLMKLKSFCYTQEKTKKKKGQPSEWEKYLRTDQGTKDKSPEYINSSCSSITKKRTTQIGRASCRERV